MREEVDVEGEQRWNSAALAGELELPAVRVWTYLRPGVVLGRTQRLDEERRARARRVGLDVCERSTGGGAVLAGPWLLAASVVLPAGHPLVVPSIPASYRWIGELHAALLRDAGIAASVAAQPIDAGELRWACYGGLSHGEIAIEGRKLLGLAQARRRAGTLFSTGLLVGATPWADLAEVMGEPPSAARALAERTTWVTADLGDELDARLAAAIGT